MSDERTMRGYLEHAFNGISVYFVDDLSDDDTPVCREPVRVLIDDLMGKIINGVAGEYLSTGVELETLMREMLPQLARANRKVLAQLAAPPDKPA